MNRRGQALVEFVLILPIFIMLLFAVVDFGRIINKKNELENTSIDIINMLNSDIALESVQNEYSKIVITTTNNEKYTSIYVSEEINLITPGLNRIFGNPYKIEIERKIPNV